MALRWWCTCRAQEDSPGARGWGLSGPPQDLGVPPAARTRQISKGCTPQPGPAIPEDTTCTGNPTVVETWSPGSLRLIGSRDPGAGGQHSPPTARAPHEHTQPAPKTAPRHPRIAWTRRGHAGQGGQAPCREQASQAARGHQGSHGHYSDVPQAGTSEHLWPLKTTCHQNVQAAFMPRPPLSLSGQPPAPLTPLSRWTNVPQRTFGNDRRHSSFHCN